MPSTAGPTGAVEWGRMGVRHPSDTQAQLLLWANRSLAASRLSDEEHRFLPEIAHEKRQQVQTMAPDEERLAMNFPQ